MENELKQVADMISAEPIKPPVQVRPRMPNIRKNLREAVEDVFHEMGGTEGMVEWVNASTVNKRIFYKDILPKVIPKQIEGQLTGANGGPVKMVIEWATGPVGLEPPAPSPENMPIQALQQVAMNMMIAGDDDE